MFAVIIIIVVTAINGVFVERRQSTKGSGKRGQSADVGTIAQIEGHEVWQLSNNGFDACQSCCLYFRKDKAMAIGKI